MDFTVKKCIVLRIQKYSIWLSEDYKLKGQTLDPLHSNKYLGVYLSNLIPRKSQQNSWLP